MLAEELQAGDVLLATEGNPSDDLVIYEVIEIVSITRRDVHVKIRFKTDGGQSVRSWPIGTEVPHIRPSSEPDLCGDRVDGCHRCTDSDGSR